MWYIGQSLIAVNHRGCLIQWNDAEADDVFGYYVYMREGDVEEFKRVNDHPLEVTHWESPPLRLDLTYYFYITSIDRAGNESEGTPIQPFILSDATPDPTIVLTDPPKTQTLSTGDTHSVSLFEDGDFMTQFQLGETL